MQFVSKPVFTLKSFPTITTTVTRSLDEARFFVTAMGTVDFILNLLLKSAKNRRSTLINDFLDKIEEENLKEIVPQNLANWLNAECKKSGGRISKKKTKEPA